MPIVQIPVQESAVREPASRGRQAFLFWAQIALALTALVLSLRGIGHHSSWLALALVLPALRFVGQSEYRQRLFDWLHSTWATLADHTAVSPSKLCLAALVFVVAPAWILFLGNDRVMGTGDTWPAMRTAWSLVSRGTWDIKEMALTAPRTYWANPVDELPYCALRRGDAVYSSYPAGMVAFALPVAALSRIVGADLGQHRCCDRLEKWTAASVTALALGLFFLVALHLAPPWPAWLMTVMLGTGSALFSTCGQALWQHSGLIFWSLLILWIEFRQIARPVPGGAALQGWAAAMMLACRLNAVVFLVPFALWMMCRQPRRAMFFAVCAMVAYAPWAWIYSSMYGNSFGPSMGQLAAGNWSADLAESLAGVFISPARGFLIYQPWTLLAAAGCFFWTRRSGLLGVPGGWPFFCLGVIFLQIGLVAYWRCWWGGNCWGSRLMADVMPLMALLCLPAITWMSQIKTGRACLLGLVLVSFLLHAVAVYGKADHWNNIALPSQNARALWSWSKPPFLFLFYR
jgi:hypothetical protein